MADDIAALIKHLRIGKADIMGYSLGGGVALRTTVRRPDVVRNLACLNPLQARWMVPEIVAEWRRSR